MQLEQRLAELPLPLFLYEENEAHTHRDEQGRELLDTSWRASDQLPARQLNSPAAASSSGHPRTQSECISNHLDTRIRRRPQRTGQTVLSWADTEGSTSADC